MNNDPNFTKSKEHANDIKMWFSRMLPQAKYAVDLFEKINFQEWQRTPSSLWAGMKFVENVQECCKGLFKTNEEIWEIFRLFNQNDFKALRSIIVHEFWKINRSKVWEIVKNDFPKLIHILEHTVIQPVSSNILDFCLDVPLKLMHSLKPARNGMTITEDYRCSIVCLSVGPDFKLGGFLVGVSEEKELLVAKAGSLYAQDIPVDLNVYVSEPGEFRRLRFRVKERK